MTPSGRRATGRGRVAGFIVGLGLAFGFVGTVFAIAWETFASLPDGVQPGKYVTLGRRGAESDLFQGLANLDFTKIPAAVPEAEWSYARWFTSVGQVATGPGVAHDVKFRRVSGNFLSVLGVKASLGRLDSGDDAANAVISTKAWRVIFNADADILGKAVDIGDGVLAPIIGVADPEFVGIFDEAPDVWVLADENSGLVENTLTVSIGWYLFGALPEDLTLAAVQSLVAGHRLAVPEHRLDRVEAVGGLELRPDAQRETRQRLGWLAMVVALLLALSFAALVDFLAASHAVEEDSHIVRLAIGATPADVFLDSVARHAKTMLGVGVVAFASFLYANDVLLGMEPFAPALGELGLASSAMGAGASMALLVLAFLISCWLAGRSVSRRILARTATAAPTTRWSRIAWAALLFMAASSLLLTLSIGLRFASDRAPNLGFANHDALMVGASYYRRPTPAQAQRIRRSLSTDPTVKNAGRAEMLPLVAESILPKSAVKAKGYPALTDVTMLRNRVDAAFFDVLDVDLLGGSFFDGATTGEVVLSRTVARLFDAEIDEVLGTSVEFVAETPGYRGGVFTVVGVVEDIPYGSLEEASRPVIYTPLPESEPSWQFQDFWLIRHDGTADDIMARLSGLGGELHDASRIATPAEILDEEFAKRSVEAVLAMACALAFVLAIVGVANTLVRTVSAQAREIGIRYALGATGADETRRIASVALVDLVVAGAILSGIVLAGRHLAPAQLSIITLPLALVALATLGAICVLASHLSVRYLARTTGG